MSARNGTGRPTVDLAVTIGPMLLANPILTASGTFGYVPAPAAKTAAQRAQAKTLISREHYASLRVGESWTVLAGSDGCAARPAT